MKKKILKYCNPLLAALARWFKNRLFSYLHLEPSVDHGVVPTASHPFFELRWISFNKNWYYQTPLIIEIQKLTTEVKQSNWHSYIFLSKPRNVSYGAFFLDLASGWNVRQFCLVAQITTWGNSSIKSSNELSSDLTRPLVVNSYLTTASCDLKPPQILCPRWRVSASSLIVVIHSELLRTHLTR